MPHHPGGWGEQAGEVGLQQRAAGAGAAGAAGGAAGGAAAEGGGAGGAGVGVSWPAAGSRSMSSLVPFSLTELVGQACGQQLH